MRIIGGEWGGRRLLAPPAGARPTADRVRQTLFDILGGDVEGSVVLDLYAGSGAIGLEALSRGAASAIFVEANRAVRAVLDRNRQETGAAGRSRVLGLTVQRALSLLRAEGVRFRFVFADPPYGDPGTLELVQTLGMSAQACLEPTGGFVLETRVGFLAPDRSGSLSLYRQHRVGDTLLHFYRVARAEGG